MTSDYENDRRPITADQFAHVCAGLRDVVNMWIMLPEHDMATTLARGVWASVEGRTFEDPPRLRHPDDTIIEPSYVINEEDRW